MTDYWAKRLSKTEKADDENWRLEIVRMEIPIQTVDKVCEVGKRGEKSDNRFSKKRKKERKASDRQLTPQSRSTPYEGLKRIKSSLPKAKHN